MKDTCTSAPFLYFLPQERKSIISSLLSTSKSAIITYCLGHNRYHRCHILSLFSYCIYIIYSIMNPGERQQRIATTKVQIWFFFLITSSKKKRKMYQILWTSNVKARYLEEAKICILRCQFNDFLYKSCYYSI